MDNLQDILGIMLIENIFFFYSGIHHETAAALFFPRHFTFIFITCVFSSHFFGDVYDDSTLMNGFLSFLLVLTKKKDGNKI